QALTVTVPWNARATRPETSSMPPRRRGLLSERCGLTTGAGVLTGAGVGAGAGAAGAGVGVGVGVTAGSDATRRTSAAASIIPPATVPPFSAAKGRAEATIAARTWLGVALGLAAKASAAA